jgi:hypothetical protein
MGSAFAPLILPRVAVALTLLVLVFTPARAADLGEIHSMFGVGLGEPATPPAHLRSIVSKEPCRCPDFCTADVPLLGPQGAMSVRWQSMGGTCRADLLTLEGNVLRLGQGAISDTPVDLFGRSEAEIVARYGEPRVRTDTAGGQLIYCGLVSDYTRQSSGANPDALIFTGFLFDVGRLHAIRVGMTGSCPNSAFLPATGEL